MSVVAAERGRSPKDGRRKTKLSLAQLIDLEARVAVDRGQSERALRERDGRIGRSLVGAERHDRALAIRTWLASLATGRESAGYRCEVALTGLGWLAAGIGVALGISAALLAFHQDHGRPINLLHALAVLLLPQWILLIVMFGAAFLRLCGIGQRSLGVKAWGALHAWSLARVARAAGMPADADLTRATGGAAAGAISARAFAALQGCAVTFNLAALATCLALVTGSDLSFAWTTTLAVEASDVHDLVTWIATPFAWIDSALVPTLEAVAASRFLPFEGRFEGSWPQLGDARAVRTWWPFIAACLTFYGLLPRALLYAWSRLLAGQRVRQAKLDSLAVEEICARLGFRDGGFDADPVSLEEAAAAAARLEAAPSADVASPATLTGAVVVVIWRDATPDPAIARAMAQTMGGTAVAVVRAGGDAFDLEGEGAARALQAASADAVVLVDAWESLQKALARFLVGMATKAPPRSRIFVVPVGGQPPAHWQQQLTAMNQAQLRLAAPLSPSAFASGLGSSEKRS